MQAISGWTLEYEGRTYPIPPQGLHVGRGRENDIVLADDQASRRHATIWNVQGIVYVHDEGSTNGTFVNGKRIAASTPLRSGDRIQIGRTAMTVHGNAPIGAPGVVPRVVPKQASNDSTMLVGIGAAVIVGLLVVGSALLLVIRAVGSSSATQQAAVPTATPAPLVVPTPTLTSVAPVVLKPPASTSVPSIPATATAPPTLTPPPSPTLSPTRAQTDIQRAARACVLIVIFAQGQSGDYYSGSGSIIDERGLILTNFHVVRDPTTGNPYNAADLIFVFVNSSTDKPPDRTFRAQVIAQDRTLDLAVLKLVAMDDGSPLPSSLGLTAIPLGDSDNVQIGDRIRVFGFPGLGGASVTLTEGVVAGFVSNRTWIKTDTEISHGNSGGTAINEAGELIGLPSRVVSDSDVSGKIGLVRPINLAKPLILKAK